MASFSKLFRYKECTDIEVLQPLYKVQVWASPVSLAATKGISFDLFSTVT